MGYRSVVTALVVFCLGFLTACSPAVSTTPDVLTYDQIRSLSYDQVKGTGLANKCPQLSDQARGSLPLASGQVYKITDLCLEPTSFFVKEEPTNKRQGIQYLPAKLLTRLTSSIEQVEADLQVKADGSLVLVEKDGIDFQAITVQLPGGERVPFLFTIKELVATAGFTGFQGLNTSTDFEGDYVVPSYRSGLFLDPKGRGVATGYDTAVALPAAGTDEELARANLKSAGIDEGHISLQIAKVDGSTGEIAGTFESEQPSDTDLGARDPLDVKVRGVFYARVNPA
ncbi:MAG: photosystem II manganese-stabilizing polypeptide [Gloeomargaritaceae cyanobacterium C42_A2020_066]|nr:photosystem II manganese-stabilizing polypeptide [Gloeomargaritaceae cyanobacterium C42_A2020_066]